MRSSAFSGSCYVHPVTKKRAADHEIIRVCKMCYRLEGHACSACQDYLSLAHLNPLAGSTATSTLTPNSAGTVNNFHSQIRIERRLEILTKINVIHDPLTRNFPPEITAAIFEFSLPESVGFRELDHHYPHQGSSPRFRTVPETWYDDRHIRSGPLLLGAVCRSWREIAWRTPGLWTTIPISLNNLHANPVDLNRIFVPFDNIRHNRGNQDRLDVLRTWLGRTGQLPLSIKVSCPEKLLKQQCEWMSGDAFFSLVNESSYRWHELEIQGPGWLIGFFSGHPKTGAPKLLSLALYPTERDSYKFNLAGENKTAAPPYVSLLGGSLLWVDIDWRRATEINVELPFDQCVELMRRAPELRKCTISIGRDSGMSPVPPRGVTTIRGHLQSLELLYNRSGDDRRNVRDSLVTQFLQRFIFPGLTELKFDKNLNLSWESVIDHLRLSCCELTSLEIKMRCDFNEIVAVLWKTPSLRNLRITDAPSDFFKLLADTASIPLVSALFEDKSKFQAFTNEALFLPNLESINVWAYLDDIQFWHRALDILRPLSGERNRYFHHRPLKKLLVNRFWHPDEGILSIGIDRKVGERISALSKAGVVVEVKDWNNQYDLLKLATEHHQAMN